MAGRQWLPHRASEVNGASEAKRERHTLLRYLVPPPRLMPGPRGPQVVLSALCLLLVAACVTMFVLYNKTSLSRPEWNSLVSDYHNVSAHQEALSQANAELQREKLRLEELNGGLAEQARLLNGSSAHLLSANAALTAERARLRLQVADLTAANARLRREQEELERRRGEQERSSANATLSLARLGLAQAQLDLRNQNLSQSNAGLRRELLQARGRNRQLERLHLRLQQDLRNLTSRAQEAESATDRRREAELLREQNHNLSRSLEEERRRAAASEQRSEEETEKKTAAERALSHAYNNLDLYCPVVQQDTRERRCKSCPGGWRLFDSKCYYFSLRRLSWTSSRAWCQTQGGDLLVVDGPEEQTFAFGAGRASDPSDARLWIGMSDAQTEGEWRWVDGGEVAAGSRFWLSRADGEAEPDDWRRDDPQGEDCGHIDTGETPLQSWMDGACGATYRWICERNP